MHYVIYTHYKQGGIKVSTRLQCPNCMGCAQLTFSWHALPTFKQPTHWPDLSHEDTDTQHSGFVSKPGSTRESWGPALSC